MASATVSVPLAFISLLLTPPDLVYVWFQTVYFVWLVFCVVMLCLGLVDILPEKVFDYLERD